MNELQSPYSIQQMRKIGRKKAVVAFLYVILPIEALVFFLYVVNDFANGLLFFIHEQLDSGTIGLMIVIFISAWLFGGFAGKDILKDRKPHFLTAVKYALFEIVLIVLYLFLLIQLKHIVVEFWSPLILIIFLVCVMVLSAWMIAASMIKRTLKLGAR